MSTFATLQSLEFVKTYLPEGKAKILEVGCGDGDLAVELKKAGFYVTAIDKDSSCVQKAKEKDLEVHALDLLDFTGEDGFDAVLFSNSLHHIHALDAALKKAKALLTSKGKLLVEDFSYELVDEKTLNWFYEMKDFVDLFGGEERDPVPDKMERWKKEHHHEPALLNSKDILKGIERNFETSHVTTVPYLYRYFNETASKFEKGQEVIKKVFGWETKLIEQKNIQSIGLRVVAKKHFSYLK